MISNLKLENFKGVTTAYDLTACNYMHGRNFVGKSAVREAILAVILGYVPSDQNNPPALKEFASDFPMRVDAKVGESDLVVAFEKTKTSVKQTAEVTLASLPGFTEQTKVLFDPSIFFGLSDKFRISKMCELVQTVGGSPDEIAKSIAGLLSIDLAPKVPIKPADRKEPFWPVFLRWQTEVKAKAPSINDLLSLSDTFWKARRTEQTAERTRLQKTTEKMTDMSVSEADTVNLPARHEVEAEKTKLNAEIANIIGLISTAQANAKNAETQAGNKGRHTALAVKLPQLKAALAQADSNLTTAQTKLTAASLEMETARLEWVARTQEQEASAKTPPKKVSQSPLRSDDFNANAEEGKTYLATCVIRLRTPQEDSEEITPFVEEIESWQEIIPEVDDSEAEEAARSLAYDMAERVNDASDKYNDLFEAREPLAVAFDTAKLIRNDCASAVTSAENAAAELKNIEAEGAFEIVSKEQLATWNNTKSAAEARVSEIEIVIEKIIGFENDKKRIEEAATARALVDATLKTYGKVIELIAQKKQEIVSGSIEAPLAIANKLASGIIRDKQGNEGKFVFQEGEIGLLMAGKLVTRTLSGAQMEILSMGLTAGLAARSKLRVLILDEVGKLDTENALKLIDNLTGMVADGDIDQFLVIGPNNSELLLGVGEMVEAGRLNVQEVA